jgi:predicted dehydrogenase
VAREHVRAFADVPGVEVAGIHSRTRSRADDLAREYGIPAVCDSVATLYEATGAELVVVAVSETSVNTVSRACFEHPWAVFLEKPPGCNLADGEDIHRAAEVAGSRVFVGLNRRFLSSTRAALQDLKSRPGTRFIHVQDQQDQTAAASLGHPRVVVDNWMYANSIHVIDYLRLFGRGDVTAVTPVVPWSNGESDVVLAKVEFESGDVGLYEGLWKGPGPWAVSISMPEMRWEMRPLESAAFQASGERQVHQVEVHKRDEEFKPGFRLQAEMAVAAARDEPSESPTLGEAMETMRLIGAIFAR